jgi:hypothetical protein
VNGYRLRFSGVKDAELIGARVEALEPETGKLIGMRVLAVNQSYESGSPLEVHFGLGRQEAVDLTVALLDGKVTRLTGVRTARYLDVDLQTARARPVEAGL